MSDDDFLVFQQEVERFLNAAAVIREVENPIKKHILAWLIDDDEYNTFIEYCNAMDIDIKAIKKEMSK